MSTLVPHALHVVCEDPMTVEFAEQSVGLLAKSLKESSAIVVNVEANAFDLCGLQVLLSAVTTAARADKSIVFAGSCPASLQAMLVSGGLVDPDQEHDGPFRFLDGEAL